MATQKARRQILRDKFRTICPNVYFSPPESIKMTYPCIRYKKYNGFVSYADNVKYRNLTAYEVMILSTDPDEPLNEALMDNFDYVTFNTRYVSDGIQHDVYRLYF